MQRTDFYSKTTKRNKKVTMIDTRPQYEFPPPESVNPTLKVIVPQDILDRVLGKNKKN